jgi:hypothetical protein
VKNLFSQILIVVVIVLGACAWHFYNKNVEHGRQLHNLIAQADSLKEESDGVYQRLAIEITSNKDLREQLKVLGDDLYKVIKAKDEEINSLSRLVLKWQTMYLQILAVDSTSQDNAGNTVTHIIFKDYKYGPITISGMASTPPPVVEMKLSMQPMGISVVITQLSDLSWNSRVVVSDNYKDFIELESLDVSVKPLEKASNAIAIGLGFGYPYGLKGNVGYKFKSHLGAITLGKGMAGVDYYYLFKLK